MSKHSATLTRRDVKRLKQAVSAGIAPELAAEALGASVASLQRALWEDAALRADLAAREKAWEQSLLGCVRRRAASKRGAARHWLAARGLAMSEEQGARPEKVKRPKTRPAGTALAIAVSVAPAAGASVSRLELNGRHAAKVS